MRRLICLTGKWVRERETSLRLLLLFVTLMFVTNVAGQTIRYVKQGGTGNGSSWASASADFQAMINASVANDQVWVAAGNYQPASGQSFGMKNGVKIYGGFAASGTPAFADRNWITNITILTGNNNRVVNNWDTGVGATSILDGFTITGGSNVAAGGAMINIGSSPQLTNLIITGNSATEQGGAFYLGGSTSVFTNVIIKNNTLTNGQGGGIFAFSSSPTLINTLIYNNTVTTSGRGGGIFCNGAGTTFINSTIANNTAEQGPGVYFDNGASLVKNTIIWNNGVFKNSGTVEYTNSLVQGSGGSAAWNTSYGTNSGGNIDTNPFFTNANGGDFTLDVASPAVNTGNNSLFTNAASAKDLAGNNRLYGNIDMGAYEVQSTIAIRYVKAGGTGSGSSWASPSGNLQAMINASVWGCQVWVAAGTYQQPSGQSFSMKPGVGVFGGFPATGTPAIENRNSATNITILQGNNASVINNNNNGVTNGDVLNGFTITGGAAVNGGGISNVLAYPSIENCIIRNNSASNWGGGLYNEGFAGSSAGNITQYKNCLIYANTASGGGAAFDYNGSKTVYTNCTITKNHSTQNGGGIHNYLASFTKFENTIVWGNTAAQTGKQFYILSDGNSTITANYSIYSAGGGDIVGTILGGNNKTLDPQFINPGAGNFVVPKTSPAVDAGNSNLLGYASSIKDIANNIRVYGTNIDIGAYELLYPINRYVKQGASGDGLSWATASGNFGEMLNQSYPGSEVWVAKGTFLTNGNGTFTMRDGVKVYGGFPNTGNPVFTDRDPVANVSTLMGNQSRAITNDNNNLTSTALLDGFTITNGRTSQGGAILNINSSPQFANLIIHTNEAFQDGGGVYMSGSSSTFTNVIIRNNRTGPNNSGGGVYSSNSTLVFNQSTLTGNNTTKGGGMYASGSTIIFNNGNIENNTAHFDGGGLYATGSTITSDKVTVSNNTSNLTGGGIYLSQSGLTMTKSSINNNGSGEGGGVFSFDSQMSFTNSIVNNNYANTQSGRGGGLFVNGANGATFLNTTITNNNAFIGHGVYFDSGNSQIKNTIVNNDVYKNAGTVVYTNSLIHNSGGSSAWKTALGTDNGGNLDADPQFGANYVPSVTSPARNSGSNALFPNAASSLDLAGNARVFDGTIDMGAYENRQYIPVNAAGILYVVKGNAGNGTAWGNAMGELALALKYAKLINDATPGTIKEIWVAKGKYKPMYNRDNVNSTNLTDRQNTFQMVEGVKIYGHFNGNEGNVSERNLNNVDNETILSGDYLDNDTMDAKGLPSGNLNENTNSVVVAANITTGILDGFTITSGNADWYGGGIYTTNTSVTLSNLDIKSNFSGGIGGGLYLDSYGGTASKLNVHHNKATGSAGGVLMQYSSGTLEQANISNNHSMEGGGLIPYQVTGFIRNLVISNNYGQYGGGISTYGGTNMQNILITGNIAFYGGGVIAWDADTMTNCTITGNSADYGDGIATQYTNLSLRNSIVAFNGPEPDHQIQNDGGQVINTNNLLTGSGGSTAWNNAYGVNNGNNIDGDPLFTDVAAGNYKLNTSSPAINAGATGLYSNAQNSKDLAGLPRVYGNVIDMGVYEKQFTQTINKDGILYVVKGSTGTGNSWVDATGELGDALKTAKLLNDAEPGAIKQIWVAKGKYKPMYQAQNVNSTNLTDNTNTFLMVEGVSIYGHFNGNEATLAERDLTNTLNETILSGDFNDNDTVDAKGLPLAGFDENAAHVVIASAIVTGTLDGFSITGGNSTLNNYPYPDINGFSVAGTSGGGIYARNTGVSFTNLAIHSNSGSDCAGFAFDNYSGTASKLLVHHNKAVYAGGAGMINYSSGILEDSTISDNYSENEGGALYLNYNTGTLRNLIIRNNRAEGFGGGIMAYEGGNLINLLITGNSAYTGGGVSLHETTVLTNCTFTNNTGVQGAAIACFNETSYLRNSIVTANGTQPSYQIHNQWGQLVHTNNLLTGSGGSTAWNNAYGADGGGNIDGDPLFTNPATGDYTLQENSIAINSGNTSLYINPAVATDLAGNKRLYGSAIDLGAYESQSAANCSIVTTWNGNAWSNGTPVSFAYKAIIEGDYTSGDENEIKACALTVNSGNVIVSSGDNFIIKGAVNVTGGSLTFEDNANLVQTDNVANSGNITYKKVSSELHNFDYTIWSSPTAGTQTLKQFSPQTLDERFYVYNTSLGVWSNHTSASGIFGGTPSTVYFTKAKGYMVRMPAGLSATGTSAFEGIFTGVPNNGDIAIAAPAGFNAVGNPYPSPINIHNFIDANAGTLDNDGTLYFWRKTNNTLATTYATINKIAYVKNAAEGGDTGTGYFNAGQEANWVINPGQGFFVKSLGGLVNFNNTMRRALNNGQFFRGTANKPESDISRYWLNVTGAGDSFGEMAVAYTATATIALDYGLDGRLVNDGAVSLYSLAGATKLAIQARPTFINTDVVPLGFKATTAGSYIISLANMDGLFKGDQNIYLRDKNTAIIHNLKASDYSFVSEAGTFADRFEVLYTNSTLGTSEPVATETNLVVYKQQGSIHIEWANEIIQNVKLFDIRGRLIYQNNNIDGPVTVISNIAVQQQVLLVEVTTNDNRTSTKKIIY
jgi:hypothetical protein